MLEPLLRCNLACAGCGKIQYPAHVLKKRPHPGTMLPRGGGMRRADGEHPRRRAADASADRGDRRRPGRAQEIHLPLHQRAAAEREDSISSSPASTSPSPCTWMASAKQHDFAVCREGTYDKAVEAIKTALARGFRVTTNTTLFDGADPQSVRHFFDDMMELGVEGMMLSPGYTYDKAPDQDHFLSKTQNARPLPPDSQQSPRKVALQPQPAVPRIPDGQARITSARPGACPRTTSSAGRSPATFCRTATRTPSRN